MKEEKTITAAQAYAYATARCAASEQCRHDIMRKLVERGLSPDETEEILDRLEREKFIDEERYARAFVNDKYRFNGWGRLKISRALAEKGIVRSLREEALEGIDETEYAARLESALETKARSLRRDTPRKRREKLIRFGLSRGYTFDEILDLLPDDETDDETDDF